MPDRSKIEWTDATWNPVRGCSRVSEGCRHCYAERIASRFRGPGQPFHGFADPSRSRMLNPKGKWTGRVELIDRLLDHPLRWRKPRRIFVCSMSDLFHEALPDEAIDRVFSVMALADRHTFQILTKRPLRMLEWVKSRRSLDVVLQHWKREGTGQNTWPLPNVHLGVSAEGQERAEERIPILLQTPAAVRFASLEPLLGPVDLREFLTAPYEGCDRANLRLDQVIVGCESGPGARPMSEEWVRSIRDQCVEAGVPFFLKQLRVGGRIVKMPELDCRVWGQMPEMSDER